MINKEVQKPGQSDQLILPSEAIRHDPKFFEGRQQNWILRIRKPDGKIEEYEGADWEVVSPFGSVRSAVVTDEAGKPVFDRPRYEEAPNVNIVAWGRDKNTAQIRVALISQPRPHADDPTNSENTETLIFAQIPMGFKKRILGEDQLEAYETSKQAGVRETAEETGASVIKDISQPEFPYHNPNPTFVGTWSDLVFVEVDLERIEALKQDRNEPIFKAEYIPLKQIWKELRAGKTDRGITRMCTSNSALLIFFTYLGTLVKASKERGQS
jgi:hypothetical protein